MKMPMRVACSESLRQLIARISLLWLGVALPLFGQALSLTPGSASPGASVTLNLSLIAASAQPAGLQWTLQYPAPDITSITAVAGSSATAAGKAITCAGASGS